MLYWDNLKITQIAKHFIWEASFIFTWKEIIGKHFIWEASHEKILLDATHSPPHSLYNWTGSFDTLMITCASLIPLSSSGKNISPGTNFWQYATFS